jgi:dTDP-4-amino-4,6-dideoxygalactose transaminase
MVEEKIPFNRPYLVGRELLNAADAVLVKQQLSGGGYYGRGCAEWLQRELGAAKALLTHSCTAALEMAALLCDIGPGDEVIMPSFTFASTANAFVLRGAVPVFVDIRPDTLNLDERQVEAAVTSRTRAIVPVHYSGFPCDMPALLDIARRYELYVIEDAAQALLSRHKGRALGTIGDIGCLSFHETKNIIAGEAGAILVNNPKLIARAEIIWEKGTNRVEMLRGEVDKYTWLDIGSSFSPSEIIAAFLHAQFERASEIIGRRRQIHDRYRTGLRHLEPRVTLPLVHELINGNAHIFYVLTSSAEERKALIAHLRDRQIQAIFHYIPLHSAPAGQRYCRTHGAELPVTDRVSTCLLRLPLFYEMRDDQVDRVVDGVVDFYRGRQ